MVLIAGCAHRTGAPAINDPQNGLWSGRIGVQIQSQPPQSFFAGFELKGQAGNGELVLTSPIGSTLARMRWSADEAVLESGQDVRRYPTVDALLEQTTGAAIPVSALFDWLGGKDTRLNGWSADLAQQPQGKITAQRLNPSPQVDLRIVLDQ
ncbi:MAG: putative lipoprotein [Polaromonas sp.]|nr:putative lipoprotein [Polaromonas sp.]